LDELNTDILTQVTSLSRNSQGRALVILSDATKFKPQHLQQLIASNVDDIMFWQDNIDTVDHIAGRLARGECVDHLVASPEIQDVVVGGSPVWTQSVRDVVEATRFTDDPILLTGETGTGKEVVAQLVHQLDEVRKQKPISVVDCAAIVPTLSGSEFFGHERGAFTGATGPRDGAFALADEGVLFLDEIGELSLDLQVQLLRVLQEKRFKRVGGNTWRETDFRLVCATNRDLTREVEVARFRRDLYYRIAGCTVTLPPLSQRTEDILPLANHFLRTNKNPTPLLDPVVRCHLISRPYPGNVRELKQLCMGMRGSSITGSKASGLIRTNMERIHYAEPRQRRFIRKQAISGLSNCC
jgi:transcriptional regulator with GAF, ATPase, and Fis domain